MKGSELFPNLRHSPLSPEDYAKLEEQHKLGTAQIELSLRYLFRAMNLHSSGFEQRFSSKIADDYFFGPIFLRLASEIEALLNGETGKLDPGYFCRDLEDLLRSSGYSSTQIESRDFSC
jgi:hypothetical protein